MKILLNTLLFATIGLSGISAAQSNTTINCKINDKTCPVFLFHCGTNGKACAMPPVPPSPPAPPPAVLPPPPPTPPQVPEMIIPEQAHAACSDKASGTEITWVYEKKSRFNGKCVEINGKKRFEIIRISIEN